MASQHKVIQGEYLAKIAANYGFVNYLSIWKHPNNAGLVKLRKSPNVLAPGDTIYIPDRQSMKSVMAKTGMEHWYRLAGPSLKLRIAIRDYDNEAVQNADCELEVEGKTYKLRSDAKGLIEHEIPRTSENGNLRISDLGIDIPLKIGYLLPTDKEFGWKARLFNLGYLFGEDDEQQLQVAIEEFQSDNKLKVTGEFDDPTKAKLEQIYGC